MKLPVPSISSVALLVAGFGLLRLVLAAVTPLTPEEAYYWTWSRFPDWSYFDHPPLASYAIGLSTAVLGSTVFGIKAAAVLWSLGWNLLWARLVRDMGGDRRLVAWSLLALNCSLLYELYGFGPTPDGPLLFGWTGTVWAVWRATGQRGQDAVSGWGWWLAAGLFMGISWLGKYAGVLLLPVLALYLLSAPGLRHWLRRPQPWVAVLLALLVFSPVLVWNARHGWVSLAFQSTRRMGEMGGFKPRYFVLLVATQLLLLTPYVFGLSVAALVRGVKAAARGLADPAERLLLLSALVPMLVFVAVSFRSHSKLNWLIPAWWPLVLLGMRHALRADPRGRWRRWGLASSALMLLVTVVASAVPDLRLPGELNIWSGWDRAARRVDGLVRAERAQGRDAFVFSPNYKISSLLWFYRPGQEPTHAQDIFGKPALQYDYFPRRSDLVGATGFLVLSDQKQSQIDIDSLRPLFDSLGRVDVVQDGASGQGARRIEIWRGTGYHGRPARQDGTSGDESP